MGTRLRTVALAAVALIAYTLALSLLGPVLSSLQARRTVSNAGSVKAVGVGVYWDNLGTNPVSSINWGVLEPGSSKNVTVYIRNEGNSPVLLGMYAENWVPSNASNYITLDWNYAGQTVDPSGILEVTLILAVSPSVSGVTDFSFDIVIVGNG